MSETYTVTFEVDVDTEKLEQEIEIDLSDFEGNIISGTAEANLDNILEEAVNSVSLSESTAPTPVGHAIEHAALSRRQ